MSSRDAILGRLRRWPDGTSGEEPPPRVPMTPGQRVARFTERMEAVRGEVIQRQREHVAEAVADWLLAAGARRVIAGLDERLDDVLHALPPELECLRFDRDFEPLSDLLFESVDAGISCCDAGVAETGSLYLASSPQQPRSLSLVPPLHVALLPRERLLDDLDALFAEPEGSARPVNRVLISGPSKSADIEQVLAYGVHGPKRLLTVIAG